MKQSITPPSDPAIERIISRLLTCAPQWGCKYEQDCFQLARHLRDWYRWHYSQYPSPPLDPIPYTIKEIGVPVVFEEDDDGYPD